MLRTSKKGQTSFNVSILNGSLLSNETTGQTLQRQIDNYTRQLQQDKRKFFRAQQNYSEIKKDFTNKNKDLEVLKSKKHKTQLLSLKGKIGTLEATLDQTINSYNDSLAKNNKLKCEIEELRKDKKNQHEKLKFLTQSVSQVTLKIEEKFRQIQEKKQNIQKMKESIIKVKQTNQMELKGHDQEVNMIKKSFDGTGKQDQRKQKQQKGVKTENIDTLPIIKLRLRNLIGKNKEKIKIIDQYKKNMTLIFQNFEEIKEESGIQQLDQITKTFLKQEDQNLFIYQYMSKLNLNIEEMKQTNQQIRTKIQSQEQSNKQQRLALCGTPEEAKRKRDFQSYKDEKSKKANQLKTLLAQIKPKMLEVFRQYGLINQDQDLQLDQGNVQMYISQMEDLINASKTNFQTVYKGQFKEDMTRYTKLPPTVNQESKDKAEEKLLEKQKLKQLASEYWERKKGSKVTLSKNNDSSTD